MQVPLAIAWLVLIPLGISMARDALHYHRARKQLAVNALADINMALYRVTP